MISEKKAKFISIRKWVNIYRKLDKIKTLMGKDCGYCKRHINKLEQTIYCEDCEARELCKINFYNLYKKYISLIDDIYQLIELISLIKIKEGKKN